jgi:hypothetical protein
MRPRLFRFARLLLLLPAVSALSGCLLALGPQRHVGGASLPPWLEPLEVGATRAQVLDVFGPPSPNAAGAVGRDHLQWTEVIRPRACRMYVLLFIPVGREPRVTRRVDAHFADDRLVDATVSYLDRRGQVTSVESLLQEPAAPFPEAGLR